MSIRSIGAGLVLVASACSFSGDTPARVASTSDAETNRSGHYGIGRPATAFEIDVWNIDVMPDGEGLPDGSGRVTEGRSLYAKQCQQCHGPDGRGGRFDQLAGRLPNDDFPFAEDPRANHTIGNYWPFATTIFDYTRRSMPYDRPGSLTDDEVYALTAYLLYLNELIDEHAVIDRETLPKIVMPSRNRLTEDDRRGGPEIR